MEYDAKFSHIIREGYYQVCEQIEFLCFATDWKQWHTFYHWQLHSSKCSVKALRSDGNRLNSTAVEIARTGRLSLTGDNLGQNPGAFLPVPLRVKGSKFLAGSQRRSEGRERGMIRND